MEKEKIRSIRNLEDSNWYSLFSTDETLDYLDKRLKDAKIDDEAVQTLGLEQFLIALDSLPDKCPRCGNDLKLMETLKEILEEDE